MATLRHLFLAVQGLQDSPDIRRLLGAGLRYEALGAQGGLMGLDGQLGDKTLPVSTEHEVYFKLVDCRF